MAGSEHRDEMGNAIINEEQNFVQDFTHEAVVYVSSKTFV